LERSFCNTVYVIVESSIQGIFHGRQRRTFLSLAASIFPKFNANIGKGHHVVIGDSFTVWIFPRNRKPYEKRADRTKLTHVALKSCIDILGMSDWNVVDYV